MITIRNRFIPSRGFMALAFWPVVFVRRELYDRFGAVARRHEAIHLAQQLEVMLASLAFIGLLVISGLSPWWLCAAPTVFYVIYSIEWLVRLAVLRDRTEAYMAISFEQEAFANQRKGCYLRDRDAFAWILYIPGGKKEKA